MLGEVYSLSTEEAIMKLNQAIVKYPNATPPLIEKMKLCMAAKDWQQGTDITNRILAIDTDCIPALQVNYPFSINIKEFSYSRVGPCAILGPIRSVIILSVELS